MNPKIIVPFSTVAIAAVALLFASGPIISSQQALAFVYVHGHVGFYHGHYYHPYYYHYYHPYYYHYYHPYYYHYYHPYYYHHFYYGHYGHYRHYGHYGHYRY
jgi:hypothetical protein